MEQLRDSRFGGQGMADRDAGDGARRLMAFLRDQYGRRCLTGQQIGVASTPELDLIRETTGHYPAIGGFDFMDYSPSRTERGSSGKDTELAIDWWRSGGIVTFCWHWNAPQDLIDEPPDKSWSSGFYTKATTFDLARALADEDSDGYRLLLRDIDEIAVQLARLQEAGVPVLWRPLHEASGGWFWWGASGPEACIALWNLMFRRLTGLHGLHNLIWVWNGQHADWYPGDETVDIIGEDIYPPARSHESQAGRYRLARSFSAEDKIVAMTENGALPDLDAMAAEGALWAWICTWYGEYVYERGGEDGRIAYSGKHTEAERLRAFYAHPLALSRDQLPDLASYPLAGELRAAEGGRA
ncbi:glycosyl hydrolase [Paenibacillus pasadenensis]|uniref:glycosyl hydrolase n=1 Tax=Paenibacillus pasadenensis TaxID=217090 RepID=UPI0003F4C172|nr:glycosyl hydrolase [Paenibacillus pasadenensis]